MDISGLGEKAKKLAADHPEQVDGAIEKGGDAVDARTGSKYEDQVDVGQDKLKDAL